MDAFGKTQGPLYDLLVVGAGLAGLTAAQRVLELGGQALVVEKSPQFPSWSNSRISGGAVHTAFFHPRRPATEIYDQIMSVTDQQAPPALARALADNSGRALDWMRQHGARFLRGGPAEYQSFVMAPPRPNQPGMVWEGRGPDVFLRALADGFVRGGGRVLNGTRGRELRTDAGRVCGLEVADADGNPSVITARNVLLADGGFQGNPELLRRYVGPKADRLALRGAETGTGDGLRMGLAVGARAVNMADIYAHCLHRDALTNPVLNPFPWVDNMAVAGIVVNQSGRRVVNEGLGAVAIANHVARHEDPEGMWVVYDERIWQGPCRDGIVAPNPFLISAGASMRAAGSLPELAGQIGVDAAQLQETVAHYNARLKSGAPNDPPRTGTATPIDQPPFHAVPMVPGITFTMGGLQVNDHGQVLSQQEQPIPGLYAAGGAMGGLQGKGRGGGYVGGLIEACVFALLSAEHVVGRSA